MTRSSDFNNAGRAFAAASLLSLALVLGACDADSASPDTTAQDIQGDTTRPVADTQTDTTATDTAADAVHDAADTTHDTTTSTLPAPSGDGADLAGLDGASGTLAGTPYAYTGAVGAQNVTWGPANPERTLFTFQVFQTLSGGEFQALSYWKINAFPATPGSYPCRTTADGILPNIGFGAGADNLKVAEDCIIEVLTVTPKAVTGRFSVRFPGQPDVIDGYFRKSEDTGGGKALAAGEVGASFVLGGETYRYDLSGDMSFETFAGMDARPSSSASPGHPVGIQIHTVPNAIGTYKCDETYDGNTWRKVNIGFYWNGVGYAAGTRQNPSPGPEGSSCSITVTEVGSSFAGSFSGTFVTPDLSSTVVVTDGLFRHIKQQ